MANKPRGYWNYENCFNEAKKYKTKMEFRKGCLAAYDAAFRKNYLKDYTWFVTGRGPRKFTYDICYQEALKYKRKVDFFNGSKRAYCAARNNGWLKDYTWLKKEVKPRMFDYDTCYNIAMSYSSKKEFANGCTGAYNAALRYGWLKDYTWFKKHSHSKDDYVVYVYRDEKNKVAYVGLSYYMKGRHYQHRKDDKDTVKRYFDSIGKEVPMYIIVMDCLKQNDAQYYEDWYKNRYAENGYKMLNKGKTGEGHGSLGGGAYKWDYDSTYAEAKKYDTRRAFQLGCGAAYKVALQNKWLDDYTWFLHEHEARSRAYRKWNYENLLEERNKYSSKKEFRENNYGAYQAAKKYGYLDKFFPKAA